MKSIQWIIPMFVFLLLAFGLNAQQGTPNPETDTMEKIDKPKKRSGRKGVRKAQYEAMVGKLNLSEAQRSRFDDINEKYRDEMRAVRENSEGDWGAVREQLKQLRKDQDAEIQTTLTDDQYTQYKELVKETRRRGARKGHRKGRQGQEQAAPAEQ